MNSHHSILYLFSCYISNVPSSTCLAYVPHLLGMNLSGGAGDRYESRATHLHGGRNFAGHKKSCRYREFIRDLLE